MRLVTILLLVYFFCVACASLSVETASPTVTVFPTYTAISTVQLVIPTRTPTTRPTSLPVPTVSPTTAPPSPTPTPNPIETILTNMTTSEKVGQLFAVFFEGTDLTFGLDTHIEQAHVGTIILFGPNIESPKQLRRLTTEAQQLALSTGAQIPLFIAVDQEAWPVARLTPDNGFPSLISHMALGATHSADDAALAAAFIATELRSVGINMNLAPVLDVNVNPLNPIIGWRSFGADPDLVGCLGAAQIEAYRANGIVATAKHFPGHGDTSLDSHVALPTIPHARERLDAVELAPFRAAIQADVPVIMTAHVTFPAIDDTPGLPATLSKPILTGLLREELGFSGIIATDSIGMDAVEKTFGLTRTAVMALEAGADMLMFGADKDHRSEEAFKVYQYLLQQVEQGQISMPRIDESVRRILQVKADYGLLSATQFESKPPPPDLPDSAQLLDIASRSVTVVRDEANLLPLTITESVLFVTPSEIGDISTMFPISANHQLFHVKLSPNDTQIQQVVGRAGQADKIVVLTANVAKYSAQAMLVEALVATDKPVIVVAIALPYDLWRLPISTSYLATYGFSEVMMQGLLQVLYGEVPAQGRLPIPLTDEYGIGFGLVGSD
ncbi:glycoside hydrolase family 3 N-terminal domain-containing protein [Anaerolineales bacterium HSG25]|nr:glycoside hydrolase family 3 N-terminal domain-containing protein [Anaerolineales bacterium HSG25]